MLTKAHRQEALSRAYIHAIAAYSGMSCSVRSHDYGVDVTLYEVRELADGFYETGLRLDLQLRSTTRASIGDDTIAFDLDVRTYNYLRRSELFRSLLLVVFVMPVDEGQWLSQSEAALSLHHCAYWQSLRGWQSTAATRSVRVSLPRIQVFSPSALQDKMNQWREGAMP